MTLRLVDADTHAGKDVFTDLRSGASGRVGEIRLVSWRPQVGGPVCAAPHILFKYSSRHPTHRPPGTVAMSDFVASVRDFTRALPRQGAAAERGLGHAHGRALLPDLREDLVLPLRAGARPLHPLPHGSEAQPDELAGAARLECPPLQCSTTRPAALQGRDQVAGAAHDRAEVVASGRPGVGERPRRSHVDRQRVTQGETPLPW